MKVLKIVVLIIFIGLGCFLFALNKEVQITYNKFQQDKYDEVVSEYKKIIETSPNIVYGYSGLGEVYKEQGKLDDALAEFKKVIEIEPNNGWGYYSVSCVYSLKKETKQAIEFLQKTIDLNESFIEYSRGDPDFDNIRHTPEFQQLIDSY